MSDSTRSRGALWLRLGTGAVLLLLAAAAAYAAVIGVINFPRIGV